VANLGSVSHETYTFLVGSQISRRQFVGAIASGALSTIQAYDKNRNEDNIKAVLGANLASIDANYDEESSLAMIKLAISYHVSILAELPIY